MAGWVGEKVTGVRDGTRAGGWARLSESSPARFVRAEATGAVVVFLAAAAAVVWANLGPGYARFWGMPLAVALGDHVLSLSLAGWVSSGLMSFFFFVVGLEARQEFDVGELRARRATVLPVLAGLGGMAAAVGLYLWVVGRGPGAGGWGVAMSTDTAFALGVLTLAGSRFPRRLRVFLLSVVVVDDLVALVVIAVAYTRHVEPGPLLVAVALFGLVVLAGRLGVPYGWPYLVAAVAAWVALAGSGVDPLIIGLAMGLYAYAAPAGRDDLARASDLFRGFREQPTPRLARAARLGLVAAISPNERLQEQFHRWSGLVIVPLFALSNAGVSITGPALAAAARSPITLGVVLGYVVGKPVGVAVVAAVVARVGGGRWRAPVGWWSVGTAGTLAGIGFTVALLVASLAFTGVQLDQAKLGVLAAAVISALISCTLLGIGRALPRGVRARWLLGRPETITDLAVPVDPERDHVRGPDEAPVTLVEYGDFECPFCGLVEPVVRTLLAEGELRYVWRHLPLADVHPHAQRAAEAAEAAARQGRFWEMHDVLLAHQGELRAADVLGYARRVGLDVERFRRDLTDRELRQRVAADADGAEASGAAGTPTFFVNGVRHRGAYALENLSRRVSAARVHAGLDAR